MKIAFCLHGLVGSRSSKYGLNKNINLKIPYSYFQKNIFKNNSNVDIFLHSQSYEAKKELIHLYKPKSFKIEKLKDFSFSIKHPHLKRLNILRLKSFVESLIGIKSSKKKISYLIKKANASYSRWYSFKEAIKLMRQYERKHNFKYDIVFITRYDLIIKKKFYLNLFNKKKLTVSHHNSVPGPRNNYMTKPQKNNKTSTKGLSDLWFASCSENMVKFSKLFDQIENYPISNHFSSFYHAKYHKLKIDFKYFRYFDFELWRRLKLSIE